MGGHAAIVNNHHRSGSHVPDPDIDMHDGTYRPYMINTTQFNRPYMVAVATPNTQRAKSQFFITTVKAQWLSELQYTIFGMVLEGRDYIHTIEQIAGTYGGRPKVTVQIVDCGELPLQPYDTEPHY
jgi:cyclophilin family peptidyl-prolyl cis-trans isomerase